MHRDPSNAIRPLPYSASRIVAEANNLIDQYMQAIGNPKQVYLTGITFQSVFHNVIVPKYRIVLIENEDLGVDEKGHKILGLFDPENRTAFVDRALTQAKKDPRYVFTCWHEVGGHGVLQGDWLRRELRRLKARNVITTEDSLTEDCYNTLERQANIFSANAAAPMWLIDYAIARVFDPNSLLRYKGPRQYCLSVHGRSVSCDISSYEDFCSQIAEHIRSFFGGLSRQAIAIRVQQSRLLHNAEVSTRIEQNRFQGTARLFRLPRKAS